MASWPLLLACRMMETRSRMLRIGTDEAAHPASAKWSQRELPILCIADSGFNQTRIEQRGDDILLILRLTGSGAFGRGSPL